MKNIVSLLKSEAIGVGPEEKYAIVRLLHLSNQSAGKVVAKSARTLAGDLSISVQSMTLAVRHLESQGHLERWGDWSKNKNDKEVTYVLTPDFYASLNRKEHSVSLVMSERVSALLVSKELSQLSVRSAVKLLLLTLVAHADDNGIVGNLAIKTLASLLGRFSKDRHRSQLALLKRKGFILGYNPGASEGVLFGKQSSEYLVNMNHPAFHPFSAKCGVVVGCEIKHADELCYLASLVRDGIFVVPKDSPNYQGSNYSRMQKLQQELCPNDEEGFGGLLRDTEGAFEGEGKGRLLQRYVLKLALELLKGGGNKECSDAIYSRLVFGELFSNKFIASLPENLGIKPEDNWLQWRGDVCRVEAFNREEKRCVTQLIAIIKFIEKLVRVSVEALRRLLEKLELRLKSDSCLALFYRHDVRVLYLFNLQES